MIYLLINSIGIFIAAFIGEKIGNKLKKTQVSAVTTGASLALLIMGIQGAIETKNSLLVIFSLTIGGVIGSGIDIEGKFESLGDRLLKVVKTGDSRFSEGLVAMIMLQVIGSMAILGPINLALINDPSITILKTILDFVFTIIFSADYGKGVGLSGVVLFIYQGIIFLLAGLLVPFVTPEVSAEISAVGSVIFVALALNLLDITKIKISNFLPGIFGPLVYFVILNLI